MSIYGFDDGLNKTETPTKAEHDAVAQYTEDSGWIYPTLGSKFSNESDQRVRYRKIGKIVFIEGAVTSAMAFPANASYDIFTLPAGYRPSHNQYFICKGTGKATYDLRIYENGRVNFSRYGVTNTDTAVSQGTWMAVNGIFSVD